MGCGPTATPVSRGLGIDEGRLFSRKHIRTTWNASILSQGHGMIEHMIGGAVGELLAGMERVLKVPRPRGLERAGVAGAVLRVPPHGAVGAAGKALCARQMAATPGLVLGRAPLALSPHGRGHRLLRPPRPRPAGCGRGHEGAAGHGGQVPGSGRSPSARPSRWRRRRWPIPRRRRSCWSWPSSSPSSSCNRPRPGSGPRPPTRTSVTAGPIAADTSGTGSTWRAPSASPAASPPRRGRY